MKRYFYCGVLASFFAPQLAVAQTAGLEGSASTTSSPTVSTTSEPGTTSADASADSSTTSDAASQSSATLEPVETGTPSYAGARAAPDRDANDAARFARLPYMQRYKPTANLWEIGVFGGGFFPSRAHNLQEPGNTTNTQRFEVVGPEVGARVAYYPLSFIGVEVEGMVSPTRTREDEATALLWGARVHGIAQLPLWSIVPFVTVGGGLMGGHSRTMGSDADPAFHFGVGVKAPLSKTFGLRLDLRDTLAQKRNQDQGTLGNSFDILLGATVTFDREPPPRAADTDYDGLFDDEDKCPQQGALTVDGCPRDSDGDGVFDPDDRCPNDAANTADGCPVVAPVDTDVDQDGIPTPCDACPAEKGVAPDGCPIKDQDGDGLNDDVDKCPKEPETRNGFEDQDGCPDQVPEAMKRFTGVMRGIAFEQGKAKIRKESFSTLDAAYDVLAQHTSIRMEISGHTSSEGTAAVNQKLSEDRAAAVKDYLVKKGIAADRLITRGAGPNEPIADNATRTGREENRRIEFKIVADP